MLLSILLVARADPNRIIGCHSIAAKHKQLRSTRSNRASDTTMTPAYKRQRLAQLDSNAEMEQRLSGATCNLAPGLGRSDSKRNVRLTLPTDYDERSLHVPSPAASNNHDISLSRNSMACEPWSVEPSFWSPAPSLFKISSKSVFGSPCSGFDEAVLTDRTILLTPASIIKRNAVGERVVDYDLVELAKQMDALQPVGSEASYATQSLADDDDDDTVVMENGSMDVSSFLWSECGGVRTRLEPWDINEAFEKEFEEPSHLPFLLQHSWSEESVSQLEGFAYTGEMIESPPLNRDIFERMETDLSVLHDQTAVAGTLEPIDVSCIWGNDGESGVWDLNRATQSC